MLVGDKDTTPNTYQYGILDKLVTHIRKTAEDFDIPVVTPDSFDLTSPSASMPNIDPEDYNG